MPFDIQSLISAANWWEYAGYGASFLVLVGVVIESIHVVPILLSARRREHIAEIVGFLLLVIGLGGEILTQVQSNNRTGLIIAALHDESATALKKAEEERLERIKLEALIAPRTLSLDQQRAIARSLRLLFNGRRVEVVTYALDAEAAGLAAQIMASLGSAGIEVENKIAALMPLGGFSLGIHVTGPDDNLVAALRSSLAITGRLIVAPAGPEPPGGAGMQLGPTPGAPTASAIILVGVKPVPIIR